ncbi:YpdA family putative bacillithiol disulfide reductase [Virgibacillus sp. 179-BFC.A HS]|uniref:YpdA family putative bacillithiol disulfide reductase n=1 Tax=Tigheibacillus jepli TaxID=3035914 RepID=A0ABU5CJI9_9BACI|nr:YpdA family putative bacillithiol disulfide reductase [Virgibacillus sp. 179-BFC.A HS]MDY0405683.1 YpdA family putative bacillithiol disulfide reductase [Virgibacillus sp. 179-BFC.A HS]
MQTEEVIIVGGGPCGLACAIACKDNGLNPLIIEKENVVNTIYHFPTHQTFFSSSDKLEIGEMPFITEKQKPVRIQALTYYRTVAKRKNLRINSFEKVTKIEKHANYFRIFTVKHGIDKAEYIAKNVIIATGYYDQPNYMGIEGEELPSVMHYFKEGHPYFDKNVVIIGGKNSAVDAALELHKAGANITVLYRGEMYSKSIKPWILPDFDSLVRKNIVKMEFNAHVRKITQNFVHYEVHGEEKKVPCDFVFAMTGYRPDIAFLKDAGIEINPANGKPTYNEETMETNIPGIYVAGVIAAGYNNNEIFIENGRFHGDLIAKNIVKG